MLLVNRDGIADAARVDQAPFPGMADPAVREFGRGCYRFAIPPFLLGVVAAQHVDVGGQLFVGEVLGLLFAFSLLRRRPLSHTARLLLLFALLWAVAQAVSDVLNQTALSDALKGVSAPLVFLIAILGLVAYFSEWPAHMPSFLLGAATGTVVSLTIFPTTYSSMNAWKFGVGGAVLSAFALHYSFFLRRKSFGWLFVALIAFLLISLYYDSRSMAVLPLIGGVAYALSRTVRGTSVSSLFRGRWGLVRLLLVIVMAGFLMNAGVTALFSSDIFLSRISPAAAQKYRTQASGAFGVLLGGRPDFFVSAQAFLDEPLLGHGSWARDTRGYRQARANKMYELGYTQTNQQFDSLPWIPTHSYLMGALVWSGFLGGLFWIVLLAVVLQRLLRSFPELPLYFYIGTVAFVWDVLFSPFGGSARWGTAVFLAAFLAYTSPSLTTEAEE